MSRRCQDDIKSLTGSISRSWSGWNRKLTSSCVSLTIYQQCHGDIVGDVSPTSLHYQNVHYYNYHFTNFKKKIFTKDDKLNTGFALLVGIVSRRYLGDEFVAVKFRCPRQLMSPPRWEPNFYSKRKWRKVTLLQEVGYDLGVCVLNLYPEMNPLRSLVVINHVKMEKWFFKFTTWPHVATCVKGYVALWMETPHGYLPSCHICLSLVQFKWRYYVFNLAHDLTRPRD